MQKEKKNEEKQQRDMLSQIRKNLSGKNRMLLIAIAVLLLLVILFLSAAAIHKQRGKQYPEMAELIAESMASAGFPYLPKEEEQLEAAADAAAAVLDGLLAQGADRQQMIQAVKDTLLELGWELSEEDAAELAEWLVDIYLENVEKVYGKDAVPSLTAETLGEPYIEEVKTDLKNIAEYLEQLDQSVTNHKEELTSLTTVYEGDQETVREELNRLKEAVSGLNLTQDVDLLTEKLLQVHQDISLTQEEIKQALALLESGGGTSLQDILERFSSISTSLAGIQTGVDSARGDLGSLIESVKTKSGEEHKELLGLLKGIDSSFSKQNAENYESLVQSLQTQTENMQAKFDALSNSFQENYQLLMENVSNMGLGVTEGQDAILQRIAEMENSTNAKLSGVQNDIQSVFGRVSNGKALLASALLTKNVTIPEDATFQEIYDGILQIKQELVIGVEKIPGVVEYEYHYHTGDAVNGGGCYTTPDVHQHVGSCYQACEVRYDGCGGLPGDTSAESISRCPYREWHSYCYGGEFRIKEYRHYNGGGSQSGHRSGGSYTHYVAVCGRNEGQSYGWKTSCGLNDGQIVGAHIVYDAEALQKAAANEALSLPVSPSLPQGGILEGNEAEESEMEEAKEQEGNAEGTDGKDTDIEESDAEETEVEETGTEKPSKEETEEKIEEPETVESETKESNTEQTGTEGTGAEKEETEEEGTEESENLPAGKEEETSWEKEAEEAGIEGTDTEETETQKASQGSVDETARESGQKTGESGEQDSPEKGGAGEGG